MLPIQNYGNSVKTVKNYILISCLAMHYAIPGVELFIYLSIITYLKFSFSALDFELIKANVFCMHQHALTLS